MAYNFTAIEKKWQHYWLEHRTFRALEPAEAGQMPKAYILDMFPYPSGAGLHVGHPEGYTATDIVSRYKRMKGFNVLHPMGWDAFGLPAEQYAIKTNTHPRLTTEANINNFRRQIQMLGLSYDWQREVDTTDPKYYRWTQWIFLQLFNSYFDPIKQKAMPIGHLIAELDNQNYVVAPDGTVVQNPLPEGLQALEGQENLYRLWRELEPEEQRDILDGVRLAYMDEIPVNWCPGLGTVLANEEVIDGKSEVGGFPVDRRPMRQWMLRITAYADRLLKDLDLLDWPESLKEMQRNWIGRSTGAEVDFELDVPKLPDEQDPPIITVFTTRPDTLYGATYMVLAPEHPLVDRITSPQHRQQVDNYRQQMARKSDRDRLTDSKQKTGVFTGGHAINPVNDQKIPIYLADYVMMSYGTGAIMAVPAHDQRDYDFAKAFGLPINVVVAPAAHPQSQISNLQSPISNLDSLIADHAFEEEGVAVNSDEINGLPTLQAKQEMTVLLDAEGVGHPSVKYKLRDWLFSRQRYWGEPFPIVLDEKGNAFSLQDDELPLLLPEIEDFKPTGTPEPPLTKAKDWIQYQRDGRSFTRETNTMPQWAGSCWYYLRYLDPTNEAAFVDKAKEAYWMPVDLYVGGVEHAVLHLLYARFWHKVLFDLDHVSTPEPFQRLVNQGLILGEMEYHVFHAADGTIVTASDARDIAEEATSDGLKLCAISTTTGQRLEGQRVNETEIEKTANGFRLKTDPNIRVDARSFKMSKSRGNVVNPDGIVADYGADTFRLYEMYMGPLEAQKPWNTRDIVGMSRFLNSVWRNLIGDELQTTGSSRIASVALPEAIERQLHRTIKKVGSDIESMSFNTAIAELIKLNNELTGLEKVPLYLGETFALLLAPLAPHIAEEIWQRLGHEGSLTRVPWPSFDPAKLVDSDMELPIQVNGRLRDKITVPADSTQSTILAAAQSATHVQSWLTGKTIVKRIYVPGKLVNIVVK